MTNTRTLVSRNQREGWYAGKVQTEKGNKHMRCKLPENVAGCGRQLMKWVAKFKKEYHE